MIVTIDGPAGAGKSTVAKRLADRLGFKILDTGAMYRAVTWAALHQGIDPADDAAVEQLLRTLTIGLDDGSVLVNRRDVTLEIRDPAVTEHVSSIADNLAVRRQLVCWQRQATEDGNYVCEGRDQGTVAFPAADVKIFLTASPEHRARRRWQELLDHHIPASLAEVLQQQIARDARDLRRPIGGLKQAADAIEVNTDGKTIDEVVDQLEQIVRQRIPVD